MILTLLLDLDDTLLDTNLEAFVPAYFQALARELTPMVSPKLMLHALMAGMNLMNENDDFSHTLEDVFNSVFYSQIKVSKEELKTVIENFYDNTFPALQGLTSSKTLAGPFVAWARSRGFRIAIATDPLFPRKATFHRVRWAGFDPGQFELISTFEDFHFSKTHPAYYAEVLGRMGWPDDPVLMVGNDIERDILPAKKLGLATFLVNEKKTSPSGPEADASGSLETLRLWLEARDPSTLVPSLKSVDGVLNILLSSPAIFSGLTNQISLSHWSVKPTLDDWALTEVFCHLRDTEREIHHMQIRLFKGQKEPFIPRPDTSVWASQRDYLHEDGVAALADFVAARRETIDLLQKMPPEDWRRTARHAIFGPTNFLEVIGFMADHDRLHVQQVWSLLENIK